MREDNNKEIDLNGRRIVYLLKTSIRAKNLKIAVKPGGFVTATKPFFVSDRSVEDFLREKSAWVIDKIDRLKDRKGLMGRGTKDDFRRLAPAARALVMEKIEKFNRIYQVEFNRVAIRDQRTRWGSCSAKGNLNFNYRIALLPQHLSDYIVVHEICHLRELNHSKKFFDLVATAIPGYAAARRELRNFFS